MTNTLLPARMFVVCCVYSYGNGFQRVKAKISADCKEALMWGIGSCMQWSATEWNTAGK